MDSKTRKLVIDTDTGSDDVWAIIEALRAEDTVRVEAVTVVHGNMDLALCTKNALIAIDRAGTYHPPVYAGAAKPLLRPAGAGSAEVHGADGLGNLNLPAPNMSASPGHAADAIIELSLRYPGELDLVALGPLTNLAIAVLKDPGVAGRLRQLTVLGGCGGDTGNASPAAEFNIYGDAEAAKIVLDSGIMAQWVTWDCIYGGCEITDADMERLRAAHSPVADFCLDCTRCLLAYESALSGRDAFGVIDTVAMTAYLYPETISKQDACYCDIETKPGLTYGYFAKDRRGALGQLPNALVCVALDAALYKERLFALLAK